MEQAFKFLIGDSLILEVFMAEEKQNEDCYFFVDSSLPEEERTINCMCLKCHDKHPETGWFWHGSKAGYGPNEFTCDLCGHMVSKPQTGKA